MTVFAQPFKILWVIDDPLRGLVVTEGSVILPAHGPGMGVILQQLGADRPGAYFYEDDNGKPRQVVEDVPDDVRENVQDIIARSSDLPPLTLARLRAPTTRVLAGHPVPDFARHLHGDGYTVRMAEGPIQLATGVDEQRFGEFRFWGAGRDSVVLVTRADGEWMGLLMPMDGGGGAP